MMGDKRTDWKEYPGSYRYTDPKSDNYKAMVEVVRTKLQLTTLQYQRLENLIKAIGLPKEKICTYCWDGVE